METNKKEKVKIFILLGPTSSGKTSTAIKLCKDFNSEIISADSRQVYKYMDVGTGKIPTNKELKVIKGAGFWCFDDVKVWGYDLVDPKEYFSSFEFAKYAINKINELVKAKKSALIVGGTGFYIDMLTGKAAPAQIEPNPKLRAKLSKLSLITLQRKLKRLNAEEFEKIDKNNPARLIRAIEKNSLVKEKIIELPSIKSNYEFITIGFTATRDYLYKKADAWVDQIWEDGVLKEVKILFESKYKTSDKLHGLVYKEAAEHLDGKITKEEAIQRTKFAIHAYIRRQQTYFKKMKVDYWVDISQDNALQNVYNIING